MIGNSFPGQRREHVRRARRPRKSRIANPVRRHHLRRGPVRMWGSDLPLARTPVPFRAPKAAPGTKTGGRPGSGAGGHLRTVRVDGPGWWEEKVFVRCAAVWRPGGEGVPGSRGASLAARADTQPSPRGSRTHRVRPTRARTIREEQRSVAVGDLPLDRDPDRTPHGEGAGCDGEHDALASCRGLAVRFGGRPIGMRGLGHRCPGPRPFPARRLAAPVRTRRAAAADRPGARSGASGSWTRATRRAAGARRSPAGGGPASSAGRATGTPAR